jgi:flagellar motor protein MotB
VTKTEARRISASPCSWAWSIVGVISVVGSSGCSMSSLREANERLRESNARLVSENNRLEHELAAVQSRSAADDPVPVAEAALAPAATREEYVDVAPKAIVDADILPEPSAEIIRTSDGVVFRFPDRVFFGLGQAKLSAQGQKVLERMAKLLETKYRGHEIRVDGHTDDLPIRKLRSLYPSNWELSTARACTVVRYLVDSTGISPNRIYPAGFAYHRPLEAGKNDSSRGRNRRVEITVLDRS